MVTRGTINLIFRLMFKFQFHAQQVRIWTMWTMYNCLNLEDKKTNAHSDLAN